MKQARKIVMIMTDTQRWDMLGCYGNPDMKTPNLDALAAQGMRFDRAYTCQPVCGPARSALFTGTYPHTNGSWTNSYAMGDNVRTAGQRLRDHGFHTAYVGKWHLDGGDYFGLGRCPDGWDDGYWYDMRCYLEEFGEEFRLRSRIPETMETENIKREDTYAHRVSQRAIDFLKKYHDEDFFLVASYDEPHHPYLCPEPYSSMYKNYEFPKSPNVWDTLDGKPDYQKVWAGEKRKKDKDALKIKAPYYFGCNSYVDDEIGCLLDTVKEVAPDALILYTSDHGDFLESHSLTGKGPAFYDDIARIPMIVKWPGVTPEGSVCPYPASHIDLLPTIMEAAGLPVPKLLEGKSMVTTLIDPSIRTNDMVFTEFGRYEVDHDGFGGFQPIRCVFDGRYKLSVNLLSSDELYDVEKDPYEMNNLISESNYIAICMRLHDALLDWQNQTRDPFRGYWWERRPWRLDARPATWEYTGMTRQRENEEYEPRQMDYGTGLEMQEAIRKK